MIDAYNAEFDVAADDHPIISAAIKFMYIATGKPSIGISTTNQAQISISAKLQKGFFAIETVIGSLC